MERIKGGISNIANLPNTVTNIIRESTSLNDSGTNSISSLSPSSISEDESEKSHAIPNSLIKEEWQLVLNQEASIPDLENAIKLCKDLVLTCEECSSERKWLVRHLVELRFRLKELQDVANDLDTSSNEMSTKIILGHHFTSRQITLPTNKLYCDHCSGIIWSVVQASYTCSDCGFSVHHKCLQNVLRVCAHILTSEKKSPNELICPELGLSLQKYVCAECATPFQLHFNIKDKHGKTCFGNSKKHKTEMSYNEPRLCDYSGLYYCPICHWNDLSVIPARIIHNWDFSSHKVGRAALQEINLMNSRPCINLEKLNPKLFIFVEKLSLVKKLREDLAHMRKYLSYCRLATDSKLISNQIRNKRHLIQSPELYSLFDLISVENGTIIEHLNKIRAVFEQHIRCCEICSGKGYICEICSNDEIIFPFDDGCIECAKCNSVVHRACWIRKNMMCIKCTRLEKRNEKIMDDDKQDE